MLHRLRGSCLAYGETEGAFNRTIRLPPPAPPVKSGVATSPASAGEDQGRMFHVKHFPRSSFANTELAEDRPEHLFDADHTNDTGQSIIDPSELLVQKLDS
jgi:hypothetical protein